MKVTFQIEGSTPVIMECNAGDNLLEYHEVPQQISGYEYEFLEAVRCIREGKLESDSMPLERSIQVMEIMDALRKQWGVVYPQEKE